jgi:hypothetical protein
MKANRKGCLLLAVVLGCTPAAEQDGSEAEAGDGNGAVLDDPAQDATSSMLVFDEDPETGRITARCRTELASGQVDDSAISAGEPPDELSRTLHEIKSGPGGVSAIPTCSASERDLTLGAIDDQKTALEPATVVVLVALAAAAICSQRKEALPGNSWVNFGPPAEHRA